MLLFLFAYPSAPCLYYRDEIGLTSRHDPDCRRTFPWDPESWDHELLAFVKQCVALRHAHPALRRGSYQRLYADKEVYVFGRTLAADTFVIALNTASAVRELTIPVNALGLGNGAVRDVWSGVQWPLRDGTINGLRLTPGGGAVLIPAS